MVNRFEGGMPPQIAEAKEGEDKRVKVWDSLAMSFGGYSQVPDRVIGMAIVGQVNNGGSEFGGRSSEEVVKRINEVVGQICEQWEDQDVKPDDIRSEILKGMKEQAKDMPREGGNEIIWDVIDAFEGIK